MGQCAGGFVTSFLHGAVKSIPRVERFGSALPALHRVISSSLPFLESLVAMGFPPPAVVNQNPRIYSNFVFAAGRPADCGFGPDVVEPSSF